MKMKTKTKTTKMMTTPVGNHRGFCVINDYTNEELFSADTARECLDWLNNEVRICNYELLRCWKDSERGIMVYDIGWTICRIEEIKP